MQCSYTKKTKIIVYKLHVNLLSYHLISYGHKIYRISTFIIIVELIICESVHCSFYGQGMPTTLTRGLQNPTLQGSKIILFINMQMLEPVCLLNDFRTLLYTKSANFFYLNHNVFSFKMRKTRMPMKTT